MDLQRSVEYLNKNTDDEYQFIVEGDDQVEFVLDGVENHSTTFSGEQISALCAVFANTRYRSIRETINQVVQKS